MLFSTLEGDGAAEGRNVREGGNYDQEAFTKAWNHLAAPTSDGEDD